MDYTPNFEDILRYSEMYHGKNKRDNEDKEHCESCCEKQEKDCGRNCFDKCEKDCDKDKECRREVCEIIASIALMEAALAHILNGEGEKLQKAVEHSCSIDELLKVNQSVHQTLSRAILLEQNLFLKLETICNCREIREEKKK